MSSRRYPGSKGPSNGPNGPSSNGPGAFAPYAAPLAAPLARPPYPGAPPPPPGRLPFPKRLPPPPPGTPGFRFPVPRKFPLGGAARLLPKAIPLLGGALALYDLYRWLNPPGGSKSPDEIKYPKPGIYPQYNIRVYTQDSSCNPIPKTFGTGQWFVGASQPLPNRTYDCLSGQAPTFDEPDELLVGDALKDYLWSPYKSAFTLFTGPIHFKIPAGSRMRFEHGISVEKYPNPFKGPDWRKIPIELYAPIYVPGKVTVLPDVPLNPWLPALDPLQLPPLAPVPQPEPLPYPAIPHTKPNEERVPSERPDNGPIPKPDPWAPEPAPVPVDPVWPYPVNPVYPGTDEPGRPVVPEIPTVDTGGVIGGGTDNPVTTSPGTHEPRPPKKDEREKKGKIPTARFAAANAALSLVTEGADLVDAIYKSLPATDRRFKGRDGKWRDKDLGPLNKALRIWNNIDKIDVDEAIKNVIQNQIEDAVIGGLSSGARKGLARKGWTSHRNPFGTPSTLPDLPSYGPATPI